LGAASERFGLRLPVFAGACVCLLAWAWIRGSRAAIERSLAAAGIDEAERAAGASEGAV
jgi:hypothetical protein